MADWSCVPQDILFLILNKINVMDDHIAFGAVCASWRSAATIVETPSLQSRTLWLMLADKKYVKKLREFYALSRNKTHKLMLPQVKANKCLSSLGWLLVIDKRWDMKLLHPFSRAQIALPSINAFQDLEEARIYNMYVNFVSKFVLSANPSQDYTVIVLCGWHKKMAFWRPGHSWTTVEEWNSYTDDDDDWQHVPFMDIICYKGKFYALDNCARLVVCDPNPTKKPTLVATVPEDLIPCIMKLYLVECSGKLLVVSREYEDDDDYEYDEEKDEYVCKIRHKPEDVYSRTVGFQVLEVNLGGGEWREVSSLGRKAMFLGYNSSFSVDATKVGGCKPNCIYFTDDHALNYDGGGRDMGVYNLQDKTIEPHYSGQSYSFVTPPMWIEPSLI